MIAINAQESRTGREGPAGAGERFPVIGHLIASNFAGGPEKQILGLSAALAEEGWRTVIGSFRERRPQVEIIELAREQGLATFLIDTRSPFCPAAALQLRRVLRRQAIDVLVTHGYKANLIGYLGNHPARVAQLPILRGYTAENAKLRLYEAVDRRLLRRFPHVLCVSSATRRLALAFGLRPERVSVLHNAIDCPTDVSPRNLRSAYGLPAAARILVAAGRLSREKGHRYLIGALAALRDDQPPICLVILGAGREAPRLAAQIEQAGLQERVRLAGFRRDLLPELAGADLVVNPSLSEGLPNVLLEALALRRPVVATDVGGVTELVVPGESGRLVPAADAPALAEAIGQALREQGRTQEMAEEGFQRVVHEFSFERQAMHFKRFCTEALSHRRESALPRARRARSESRREDGCSEDHRRRPGGLDRPAAHGG
ncbi:MAG: glycosyltransferase [Candidatus Eisenbacteria sp.]|nr:glycosyltransferase [Candidatus Eisenbacteria bacterium]